MDNRVMITMVALFYCWLFRILQLTYRDAAGLWTKDWLKPYVSMALKLMLSVALVQLTKDIIGVLIPTILIMISVYFPWEAKVLYKYQFNRGWGVYLGKVVIYSFINLVGSALCYFACIAVSPSNTLMSFILRLVVICIIFPLLWLVTTFRTKEFKFFVARAKTILGKRRGRV